MITRQPNPEGRGEIGMIDLVVNSLRMRPDRILVGEIRRHKEAEVLFEAIHTGHSVYATVHANDAREVVTRLTNPPIEIPKTMLQAISLIMIQYRNRRTGLRRTFQVAEMTPDGSARVLLQLDIAQDKMDKITDSVHLIGTISQLTGMNEREITQDLKEKEKVLNWLVSKNINTVDGVGRVIAEYYTKKDRLMEFVDNNKDLPDLAALDTSIPRTTVVKVPEAVPVGGTMVKKRKVSRKTSKRK